MGGEWRREKNMEADEEGDENDVHWLTVVAFVVAVAADCCCCCRLLLYIV